MLSPVSDVGILEGIPGWNTACSYFTHYSASVNPWISTVTTAGRHLSEFPWGSLICPIPHLDCSAVSMPGPALMRDCLCLWDKDGASPIPAGSLLWLCSPWARLQFWWVPWAAGRAGAWERWDSLRTEVHTVCLQVHNTPVTDHYFLFPAGSWFTFVIHYVLAYWSSLSNYAFSRPQWFGACCSLFGLLNRLLVESRVLELLKMYILRLPFSLKVD